MLKNVKQFMNAAGCLPIRGEPDRKLAALYTGLMCEELAELLESQGLSHAAGYLNALSLSWKQGEYEFHLNVEALDAMIDTAWVAIGGAYAMGADVEGAAHAVAENNLSKFSKCKLCNGSGRVYAELPRDAMCSSDVELCKSCNGSGRVVLRDDNGKIKKPDGFKAVDLDKYL